MWKISCRAEYVEPELFSKLRDAGCDPCFLYLHRADVDLGASEVVAAYEEVAEHHAVHHAVTEEPVRRPTRFRVRTVAHVQTRELTRQ